MILAHVFACTCGAVSGHLAAPALRHATHAICRCRDCVAAVRHLTGARPDHVDLLIASPADYTYTRGAQNLAALNLTPKGIHRVYATCCKTPMHSVARPQRLAFASLYTDRLVDPAQAGRVVADIHDSRSGTLKHKGMARVVYGVASRALAAQLRGTWRQGPFFDQSGTFALPIQLISKSDKAAAYR